MRSWILLAAAVGLLSYAAVSHALKRDPAPQPPAQPAASASGEPVVLDQVVDVTNIDAVLEPRAATDDGAPFEQLEFPARAPMEPAPAPRAVGAAVPEVVDPARAVWYGPHRFPKQLQQRAAPEETRGDYYRPSGVTVGIALYF
jgi:hypothetical protein